MWVNEIQLKLRKAPWLTLVIAVAIAFFSFNTLFALHRYFNFYASYVSFDQGIFNQVFWNGLHGRFFESSLSSTLSASVVHDNQLPDVQYHRLGQHFTPSLLLWLPLYALLPRSPATLSILQVAIITAAGFVLYALARHYLEPKLAALITVSFYGANAVIGPTLSNFHDLCQIPLFIFSLLLAMEKRWWWLFAALVPLTLAVREDAGVTLFSVGAYLILSKRYPRIGLAVCTVSFAYMMVLTNIVMPLFSEDISRRFMIERFGQFTDKPEASTLEIIWAIVSNPGRVLGQLFSPEQLFRKIEYLLRQWLPLGFVPALAPPAWMVSGFPLLQIFLQKGQSRLSINFRYAMTIVPGMFYGAILWWSIRPQGLKRSLQRFWLGCIGLSLILAITSNPHRTFSFVIPDSIQPWVFVPLTRQWEHAAAIRPLLSQIPVTASVSATSHIVPHLSARREIVRFPALELRNDAGQPIKMEYAIVDLWQLQQYQAAFTDDRERLQNMVPVIEEMLEQQEYGLIDYQDGVLLLQKGAASQPDALTAWSNFQKP